MFDDDGLLRQLTEAVVERALQGEMTHHPGNEKHDPAGNNSGNSRSDKSRTGSISLPGAIGGNKLAVAAKVCFQSHEPTTKGASR